MLGFGRHSVKLAVEAVGGEFVQRFAEEVGFPEGFFVGIEALNHFFRKRFARKFGSYSRIYLGFDVHFDDVQARRSRFEAHAVLTALGHYLRFVQSHFFDARANYAVAVLSDFFKR